MAPKDSRHSVASHVAIIMDGNGRWAASRGLPRLRGHRAGAQRVRDIVEACPDHGITHLTLFAFSTENWRRSQTEVAGLMGLFRRYLRSEMSELISAGVCVRFIGDRAALNPRLVELMESLERRTAHNGKLTLTVALNYGARDEIARAARAMATAVAQGRLAPDDIDQESVAGHLYTAGQPDPDLVIRTSGETRISNFLLWQSAYAEYEFCPVLWPDFTPGHLAEILMSFGARDRRFGAVAK